MSNAYTENVFRGTQRKNKTQQRQKYPFRIPSTEKRYPFYIPSLEDCIFFNCCRCTVFLI